MSTLPDRRTRKRLATRQAISDAATQLFMERGFDHVTLDEIAEAADVGRITVFNHFRRKEDMFFDQDDEGREVLRQALRQRAPDVSPIEALRALAHKLVAEGSRLLLLPPGGLVFVDTVAASEALRNRARAIRDELAQDVAAALALSVGQDAPDGDARLAAALLAATWTEALIQAHLCYRRTKSVKQTKALFLAIVDRGTEGLITAFHGSPYT